MNVLRIFAVDDEPPALRRLAIALAHIPGVALVGSETKSRAAVEAIRALKPDVLLVDIAMPGLSGFELVEHLGPDNAPVVIFVTAFDRHAVKAFETNAVDYLLKPVATARLGAALARARTAVEARDSGRRMQELLELIASQRAGEEGEGAERGRAAFWAYRNRALVKVPIRDLWWVEAERDYVRLHAGGGEALMRGTLRGVADALDPDLFLRVHRSAVVRRSQIIGLRRKASGALALDLLCGSEVAVGRQYARGLRDLVAKLAV